MRGTGVPPCRPKSAGFRNPESRENQSEITLPSCEVFPDRLLVAGPETAAGSVPGTKLALK